VTGSSSRGLLARVAGRLLRVRWVVRAPIWLYRRRLGFVFGTRLLMLEHIGRSTGRRRWVVLETVDHPDRVTFVVVSGFGTRAQWYRNVLAHGDVRVSVGLRVGVPARAVALTADEAADALARYATRHPRTWHRLVDAIETAVGERVDRLPMVRLTLAR
jgi:deazaflavin-dependent oxidoreductase (nitroreductase family)